MRRVAELLDDVGRWNGNLLRCHFLPMDVAVIMKIKLWTIRGFEDVLAWAPDPTGVFTVRSAYRLALDERNHTSSCATSRAPDGTRAVWEALWGCPAPSKVRVFAWRLVTNSVAMENKAKRKIETSDIYARSVVWNARIVSMFFTDVRWPKDSGVR